MESPRPTTLSLDARRARCSGVREPLGDVLGEPVLTMALTGEKLQIRGKTTADVRKELADTACLSPAYVCLVRGNDALCDDEHIYAEDNIQVIITSSSPPAFAPLAVETFATPPPAPDDLGPCAIACKDAKTFAAQLVERLRAADAEVLVKRLIARARSLRSLAAYHELAESV